MTRDRPSTPPSRSVRPGGRLAPASGIEPGDLPAVLDPEPGTGGRHRAAPTGSGSDAVPGRRAAVAVVLRSGGDDTELLLIERASHPADPWSGHMAFPGGRVEPGDRSSRHAAERETAEEVGLDLGAAGRLGRLSDLDAGRAVGRELIVVAHCYHLPGPLPVLRPNREVAEARWFPLSSLLDERRWVTYRHPLSGGRFPGIQLDAEHQVVWGLTLRFLSDFFGRVGRPFLV